jgi:hypothetical protein
MVSTKESKNGPGTGMHVVFRRPCLRRSKSKAVPVRVTKKMLEQYFHVPLSTAANDLVSICPHSPCAHWFCGNFKLLPDLNFFFRMMMPTMAAAV